MRTSLLPYFSAPEIRLGALRLSTQSVCMVGAVLLGYALALRRAGKLVIESRTIGEQYVWAVACAVVCGNLAPLLLSPHAGWRQGAVALGGLWGAFLGSAAWMRLRRLSLTEALRRMDLFAYIAPFAWILARLGCALAHDHLGIRSHSFLAVAFPGGPRYDLGLLEMLLSIGVTALFALLGRHRQPRGLYLGLWGLLYGAFRLAIEPLRAQSTPALTLFDRIASTAVVLTALSVLAYAALSRRHGAARL